MAPARRLRLALTQHTLEEVPRTQATRVLDAGCGDGLLTLALARRHARWHFVGADLREDMLQGAVRRAQARRLRNVRFIVADLTQPLPEEDFDVVLAIECLTEIRDDQVALNRLRDALRPGGLFVAQVPERSWQPILPGSPSTWREQVRQGYDHVELRHLLVESGFDVVSLTPTFRATAATAQEVRDRFKQASLALRTLLFAPLAFAVRLERLGVTWGRPQALFIVARRSTATGSGAP